MRFSWLVTAGVCAWLAACSSSSHKKVLECDPSECGPDQDAEAPDASDDAAAGAEGLDASQGGEPDGETAAAGATGEGGAGGASVASSSLEIVLVGNGSVAVANAAACLTSPCQYDAGAGTKFTLQAKPGADSRFVGWSGDCAGSKPGTSISVSADAECVATFVVQRAVALAVTSDGGGTVASTPDLSCTALACAGQVDDHTTATIAATAAPGFRFVGWSGSPECQGATQASLPIEVTQDLSCNAAFAQQFTLAVSALGANASVGVATGTCDALSCTADAAASASFHAAQLTGFRFTGWSGDKVCTGTANPLQIASVASDITCVANYSARWTASGVVGAGFTGNVSASSSNVNATCTGNTCTLDSGTTATLLAPTIAGSRLTGWSGAGCLAANQSGNGITVTPTTSNINCTANYATGVSVTGTVVGATGAVTATSTSPGANCSPGACGIDANGSVTLTAPNLAPTYRFSGWTGDPGCASAALAITLSNVTSSKSCSANYVQQFTIASLTSAGGSVGAKNGALACANNSCTVDAGTRVALSAVPDTANGYHFSGWSGNGCAPAADNPLTLGNVNATCTASFALNTFTIAASAGTNGGVTATRGDTNALCVNASCSVNFGVNVSLAATPAANYHFAGWSGVGCTPTGASPLTLKNVSATCAAAFAVNTFGASVSATPAVGGTAGITCPAGNCAAVPYGQLVNVTATANAGWSFAGWSANCGGGNASPNAVSITGNTACVASFRPIVTAVVAPPGAGTIAASGTPNALCVGGAPATCSVDLNGAVTFVATPATNSVFVNWTGACSGTSPTAVVSAVTAPANCTANFYRLWARSSGADGNDGMGSVAALADGSVVGFGNSVALDGKTSRVALVNLDANSGAIGRNTLFADSAGTGALAALGLTTSQDQMSVTALAVHTSAAGRLPWLHNEEKKWELEYNYSTNGSTNTASGEVISTTDGGYAFCVGVVDPPLPTGLVQVAMGHLTKVNPSGTPLFDTKFCAKTPRGVCLPTLPVDVVQDPATKNYTVLSQVTSTTQAVLLTTIDDNGNVKGATLYADGQDLRAAQFVPNAAADSFIVVGTRIDAKGNSNGFFAKLTRGGAAATWAYALGDSTSEQLFDVTRSGALYAAVGLYPDAKNGNEAWLLLIGEDGALKTQLSYGGPGAERANAIALLPAGGFALGGLTSSAWSAGLSDMWTLRVNPSGDITFDTTLTPPAGMAKTTFTSGAIRTIIGAENATELGASSATAATPSVTANPAQFRQAVQTP